MNIKTQKAQENILKIDFNQVLHAYEHHFAPFNQPNPNRAAIKTENSDFRRTRGNSAFNRLTTAKQELSELKARDSSQDTYLRHTQAKNSRHRTGKATPKLKSARPCTGESNSGGLSARVIHGSIFTTLGIRKTRSTQKSSAPAARLSHNPLVKQYSHPNQFPQRRVTFHAPQSHPSHLNHQNCHNTKSTLQTSQGQLRLRILRSMIEQQSRAVGRGGVRYAPTAASTLGRSGRKGSRGQLHLEGSQLMHKAVDK